MRLYKNVISFTVFGIFIFILFFIAIRPFCSIVFADDESHHNAALQLVELVYNEQAMYETAKRSAYVYVKDRYVNNPKTSKYADVLANLIMEVLDAYFHDGQTQNAIKQAFAKLYMEQFSEYELKEFIKFYRTPIGGKALQKLPLVTQKAWEIGSKIGSQVSSSPEYQQMIIEKMKKLQAKGQLPHEFK